MGLDPISMGVMAATKIAGGVIERRSAYKASYVDDENARQATLSGEFEALQVRKDERQLAGDMIVGMGASGTTFEGSSLDIIEQSARQREADIWALRKRAETESDNFKAEAAAKRRAGNAALIGAGFGALTGALGGLADKNNADKLSAQRSAERTTILGGGAKLPRREG